MLPSLSNSLAYETSNGLWTCPPDLYASSRPLKFDNRTDDSSIENVTADVQFLGPHTKMFEFSLDSNDFDYGTPLICTPESLRTEEPSRKTLRLEDKRDISMKNHRALLNLRTTTHQKKNYTQQPKEELPSEAPLDPVARSEREQRRENRIAFTARMKHTLPPGVSHRDQISPLLDINKMIRTSDQAWNDPAVLADALFTYSRKHKCSHGLHWNRYSIKGHYLIPECDHEYEKMTDRQSHPCPRCNSITTLVDRMCGAHTGNYCPRCKFVSYPDEPCNIACNCDIVLRLSELYLQSGVMVHTHYPRWSDYNEANSKCIRSWLDKHVKVKGKRFKTTTKPMTYSDILTSVVPEGGVVSSTGRAAYALLEPLVTAARNFLSEIHSTIKSFSKTIQGLGSLANILEFFLDLMSAFILVMAEMPPTEIALMITAVRHGNAFDAIIAFLHLALKTASNMEIGDFQYLSTSDSGQLLWEYVKRQLSSVMNIFKTKPAVSSTPKSYYSVQQQKIALSAKSIDEQTNSDISPSDSESSTGDNPEGLTDLLSSFCSLFPGRSAHSTFKTISAFLKDLLPFLSVTKLTTDLADRFSTWFKKVFGYWSEKTRDWIGLELVCLGSPLNIAASKVAEYKFVSFTDPQKSIELRQGALKAIADLHPYFQEHGRYDADGVRMILDLERSMTASIPPTSREHEPFCVRIFGPPGTGKSMYTPALFGPLFGVETKEEFDSLCFARGSSEFWDGAIGRPIILYDDFGQNRSTELDLIELIALVSGSPFMPNMATLSGSAPKGVSLDPKVVICCSNIEKDDARTLLENKAVARRFHLRIQCIGTGDVPKFRVVGGSLVTSNKVPISRIMTLSEAQLFVYQAYAAFLNSRNEGTSKINSYLNLKIPPLYSADPAANKIIQNKIHNTDFSQFAAAPMENYRIFEKYDASEQHPLFSDTDDTPEGIHWAFIISTGLIDTMYSFLLTREVISALTELKMRRYFPAILRLSSVAAVSLAAFYLVYRTTRGDLPESSTQKPRGPVLRVNPESATAFNDDQRLIERAFVTIEVLIDGNRVNKTNGIRIKGQSLLTAAHIFVPAYGSSEWYPDGTTIRITSTISEVRIFPFKSSSVTKLTRGGQEVDACVYELPASQFPAARDITSKFWEGDVLLSDIPASVLDQTTGSTSLTWRNTNIDGARISHYKVGVKEFTQVVALGTHGGGPGTCGGPVLQADSRTNRPILGIHIARHAETGKPLVLLINKKMVMRALPQSLAPPELASPLFTIPEALNPKIQSYARGSLDHYATLTIKPHLPDKTKLRRSPLFDLVVPHTTEPSVLHNKDPRIPEAFRETDFLVICSEKIRKHATFPEDQLKSSRDELDEFYRKLPTTAPKGVLSLEQVICGNKFINGIDMTTSVGFPGVLTNKSKKDYFQRIGTVLYPTRTFYETLHADLVAIKNGRVPDWLALSILKDERRPIAKVRTHPKTRLFGVCPLICNVLQKQFFGAFAWKLLENVFKVPYAGGIDRLGASWNTLISTLRAVSPDGFGGDYECYDGFFSVLMILFSLSIMAPSEYPEFYTLDPHYTYDSTCKALVEAINALKVPWKDIKEALFTFISQPLIIFGKEAYINAGSIISGLWVTQILDTVGNELMFLTGWNALVPVWAHGHPHFRQYTSVFIMGDDNICAVAPEMLTYFNGSTFAAWLEQYGVIFTSANKDGKALASQPIETISFLKNTTTYLDGLFAPLMEYNAAVEPINWIRTNEHLSADELCEQNCNGALRAVFFHGKPTFNEFRNAILNHKPFYKLPHYNTLKYTYVAYGYFPGYTADSDAYGNAPDCPIVPPRFLSSIDSLSVECDSQPNGPPHTPLNIPTADLFEEINTEGNENLDFNATDSPLYAESRVEEENDSITDSDSLYTVTSSQPNMHAVNEHYSELLATIDQITDQFHTGDSFPGSEVRTALFDLFDRIETLGLDLHQIDPGEVIEADPEGDSQYVCPLCSAIFYSVNRLIDHVPTHSDNVSWTRQTSCRDMMALAPVKQWKAWYTELQAELSGRPPTDPSPFLRDARVAGVKETYNALNYAINFTTRNHFAHTTFSGNETAWPMESILKGMLSTDVKKMVATAAPKLSETFERLSLYGLNVAKPAEPKTSASPPESRDPYETLADEEPLEATPESDPMVGSAAVVPVKPVVPSAPIIAASKATVGDPTGEAAQTVNTHGIVYADKQQSNIVTVQRGTSAGGSNERAELSLNDPSWSLRQILERYNDFATVPWTLTDPADAVLGKFDVINDLVQTLFAGTPFTAFNNFRCSNVNIRISLAASKFHQGRVVIGFVPKMLGKAVPNFGPEGSVGGFPYIDAGRLIELGAVQMNPASGDTAYLTIPFTHFKGFLNLIQKDCLGQLYVMVHSQLRAAADASSEIRVKLSFSLTNPEFKVPRVSSVSFGQLLQVEKKMETRSFTRAAFTDIPESDIQPAQKSAKNAQVNIHDVFREGVPIAPGRALTSDPKACSHFGERDTNLLDWGKRYRRCLYDSTTFTPPAVYRGVLPIADILSNFWFAYMYGAYRGRFRFKVRVNGVGTTSAVDQPTCYFFWQPLDQQTQTFNILETFHDQPLCISNSTSMAEFETPFLSQTAIALNPLVYKNPAQNQNTDTAMPDYGLYYFIRGNNNATTRVTIEIFVSLADEFQFGCFLGPTHFLVNNSYPGYWAIATQKGKNKKRHDSDSYEIITDPTIIKAVPEGLGDLVDKGVKSILDEVIPEDVTGAILGTLLDKPAIPDPPMWVISKPHGFLNFSTQPEPIDKLQLHPASQQKCDKEHFSNDLSDCHLDSLFNRKSYFGNFTWKVTNVAEDLLWSIPVGPMFDLPITFPSYNSAQPTILSAVSSQFAFWRGGITFIFDVVSSAFHEGRLECTFHPNTMDVPTDYQARVSQYTLSVAIRNTENTFAFTVPYLGETPWKKVWDGRPSNPPDSTASPPSDANYTTGTIAITVAAPLRVPANVAQDVEVKVYVLPANDFELAERTVQNTRLRIRPYF